MTQPKKRITLPILNSNRISNDLSPADLAAKIFEDDIEKLNDNPVVDIFIPDDPIDSESGEEEHEYDETNMDEYENEDEYDSDEEEYEHNDSKSSIGATKAEELSDDLFILENVLRKARLPEGRYKGRIGHLKAEKVSSDSGDWIRVTFLVMVKSPTDGFEVPVKFMASKSLKPESRMYKFLKNVLGYSPSIGMDLRELKGKLVVVTIEHKTDSNGNVWENIVSVSKG